ncbi:MAG TPA: Rqc2 family fibronectin-binding protein [Elainellaceae cyanobacterium]
MQTVDFTTLVAVCAELRDQWLPARLELVYQRDRHTIAIALRTLERRGWLTISWHPQGARMCIDQPPPRIPDTFTFSQQLRHQLGGFALTAIEPIEPWERAFDLQFARRPGDEVLWHLYVEIMGKYSNVILTHHDGVIVTAAHQVGAQQSSVRSIQTGQPYEPPPSLTDPVPSLEEPQGRWQERISLVPGQLRRNLLKTYRGLSPSLVISMVEAAGLDPYQMTDSLSASDWQQLFERWHDWLETLETQQFKPGWRSDGYTVMGWGVVEPVGTVQELLSQYYTYQLNQQEFSQLRHQLVQRLTSVLKKLQQKADDFESRLRQSDQADQYKDHADLLMAYSYEWQPGMTSIDLPDFATGDPVEILLDQKKTAIQNAQAFYKKHQKLRRSRQSIVPLLEEVNEEIDYLRQVEAAIAQIEDYQDSEDLNALVEIRDELVQQGYLKPSDQRRSSSTSSTEDTLRVYKYQSPSGFDVWVGRNNRQNDRLTFRLATDYDLWFHTQEIPGSHVLLRLEPGTVPDKKDLQFTADIAAFYSRARQSDQAPVVYTEPKHVYKPKGAKPGMAIYKKETVVWGNPQRGSGYSRQS